MKEFSDKSLIDGVLAHDLRAVARLITLSENNVPRAKKILASIYHKTGKAFVVGVTGSPGAGKSTLVDQVAKRFKDKGKKVAVIAVDPTSPFTGGAILGDRIRMRYSSEIDGIFIRSMATRGALGGISRSCIDVIQILDAAGFDVILIETVGVGQAEVDIVRTADTCVVVLVPGMGDSVQSIKAGILEIADIFVINKADRDGADLLQKDLRTLITLVEANEGDWDPPIVKTIATSGEGVDFVVGETEAHSNWLRKTGKGKQKRLGMMKDNLVRIVQDLVVGRILDKCGNKVDKLAEECFERKRDPYTVADELVKALN